MSTTSEIRAEWKQFDKISSTVARELDLLESGRSPLSEDKLKQDIAPQVNELKTCLETSRLAISDLPEADKPGNRKKFKAYKETYVNIIARVKDLQNKARRDQLLGSPSGNVVADDNEEDRYIAEGEEILDDNQRILRETLALIGQTRAIAADATDKLTQNNESLGRAGKDLDTIGETLKASRKKY